MERNDMPDETHPIYHMLPRSIWKAQPPDQPYRGDTLASEGFIHCTDDLDLLVKVANRFYRSETGDFVILRIAPVQVTAEIKWEAADGAVFPHIYGPLNLDAVTNVTPFPRNNQGEFQPPPATADHSTAPENL
jgi:uncharacterized protein (DUF952 family)